LTHPLTALRNSRRLQLLAILLIALSSYLIFDYVEAQPSFCASCHEMSFNYGTWLNSTHKESTNCLSCHSEPGLSGQIAVKIRGITELIAHIRGGYQIPIRNSVPVKNEQCTACHPLSRLDINIDYRHVLHDEMGIKCVDCHSKVVHHEPNEPTAITSQQCEGCHQSHVGVNSTFPLTGAHSKLQCIECHSSSLGAVSVDCASCHTPPSTHSGLTSSCVSCHTLDKFTPSTYQHPQVDEHLQGREKGLQCASCHRPEYSIASCTGAICHTNDNPRGND